MAVVYPYNQAIESTVTWDAFDGTTVTDPTTVTFRLVDPAGTSTDYVYGTDAQVTRSSTGVYVFAGVPLTTKGTWYWGWLADGVIDTSKEGRWVVGNSIFP